MIFCVLTFLLFSSSLHASGDTLYFVGNIKVSKQVTYTYDLRFTINAANQVTGYSLTDARGPNETKTKIFGSFDSSTKILSYEEKGILRSKVDLQKSGEYLCFVKASLKLKKSKLIETLSGKFTGVQPGKTEPCADGEIKLINSAKAKGILDWIDRNQPKQNEPKEETKPRQPAPTDIIKVADSKGKELLFTGAYIKFTIWDNGVVDGDRISLMINNKYILQNYTLDSTVKIIETTLANNDVDTIRVIALNEGSLPPNTAMIRIESKTELYPIEVRAKLNEVREIYLRKKKQQ